MDEASMAPSGQEAGSNPPRPATSRPGLRRDGDSPTSRRARVAAALAVTAVMLLAGGCADGGMSTSPTPSLTSNSVAENRIDAVDAAERLARAREALDSQSSFKVVGTTLGGGPLSMSFVRGKGATGSLTTSFGGSEVFLHAVGGNVYVKGDKDFIGTFVGESAVRTLGKSWLLLTSQQARDLAIFTDSERFAAATLDLGNVLEGVPVAVVDGQMAAGVYSVTSGATLWIAASGQPLPVQLEEEGATLERGILRFSRYGAKVTLNVPSAKDVVKAKPSPSSSGKP